MNTILQKEILELLSDKKLSISQLFTQIKSQKIYHQHLIDIICTKLVQNGILFSKIVRSTNKGRRKKYFWDKLYNERIVKNIHSIPLKDDTNINILGIDISNLIYSDSLYDYYYSLIKGQTTYEKKPIKEYYKEIINNKYKFIDKLLYNIFKDSKINYDDLRILIITTYSNGQLKIFVFLYLFINFNKDPKKRILEKEDLAYIDKKYIKKQYEKLKKIQNYLIEKNNLLDNKNKLSIAIGERLVEYNTTKIFVSNYNGPNEIQGLDNYKSNNKKFINSDNYINCLLKNYNSFPIFYKYNFCNDKHIIKYKTYHYKPINKKKLGNKEIINIYNKNMNNMFIKYE